MFSKKILVVDDEKAIRETLSEYLNRLGYKVKTASQANQALKVMRKFVPNLILLDYVIPRSDGLKIFPRVKRIFPYIKVIVITGRGSEEVAVKALKMGVDDYITKPFDLKAMAKSVEYYLRSQRQEIIWLNGKYHYPLDSDEVLNRYEYLRLVHARPDLGVKTSSAFFTFSRQDFYNYLKRFKEWGMYGLFGEREIKRLAERFGEARLKEKKKIEFSPFPFIPRERTRRPYRLDKFLNWRDPAQVKLEMIRETATSSKPHVGAVCRKYGITREGFYQNYRAFEARGIFGLLGRKKGRPHKKASGAS